MNWENDKKLHFNTAVISSCFMEIVLTTIFTIKHSELAYNGFTDALTLIAGIIAIYGWEYLPKWFPKLFPKRTFSTGDMYAGYIGIFVGILSFRVIVTLLILLLF